MKNKKLLMYGAIALGGYLLWRKYGKKETVSDVAVPMPRPVYEGSLPEMNDGRGGLDDGGIDGMRVG